MPRSCRPDHARRGFTLIELLVSMSIIGVMTGMMMANFHGGQQAAEIRLSSELLVSQIRAIQTSSYSGRLALVCSGGVENLSICDAGKNPPVTCPSPGSCLNRVPTGYGIHFTAGKSYTVFYDTNDDKKYDAGEKVSDAQYVSTGTVSLTASSIPLPLDLVYQPPDGKTFLNGAPGGVNLLSFTLSHQNGTLTRHVNVYRLSGKIEHD